MTIKVGIVLTIGDQTLTLSLADAQTLYKVLGEALGKAEMITTIRVDEDPLSKKRAEILGRLHAKTTWDKDRFPETPKIDGCFGDGNDG